MSDLSDEEPQLGIAVGPHHGVETREDPDGEGHVDTAGLLQHSPGSYEDAGPDDGANDDGATLHQAQRGLQPHPVLLLLHGLHLLLALPVFHGLVLAPVRHDCRSGHSLNFIQL